ncbi:MAG TPA: S41 family peptidase, partial [Ginsengibacter sp.]|nr:S41 family peptidase [Ginsengibacter sp.]
MSKRFIPVLVVLIIGGLFVAYGVLGKNESSLKDPNDKYEQILRNVGIVLEQGHYSPKKIDDKFSAEVLKNLEETLDPDKSIFYQKDIKSFAQYETQIDNEIHGAPLKSFYFIVDVYRKRFDELEALYNRALSEPMNFNIKESYQPDPEKRDYPANEKERYDFVRKKMKYQVLVKYSDLMDLRDSSKVTPRKADSTLLREAKETVSKQINRLFQTTKSHYSTDDLFSTFVNAITGTMDPHTTFMNPIDKRSFDESLSGTFYGIGAQLQEIDGQIRIASIITGMPAWKNGELEVNDVILKVGQGAQPPVDVTSYSVQDAVKLIRGEKLGSEVRLTVKKTDGTVKVISLLRDKIDLEDTYARSAIIEGANKIGFIRLPEFYADFENPSARRSSTDVAKEVKKLMDQHVDGIIIDLRQNGGGSLQHVVDM